MFKNIKSFIRSKPVLFFFILFSQVICIITTLAVTGMLDAATPAPKDERSFVAKKFKIEFSDDNYTREELTALENDPANYEITIYDPKEKKYLYAGVLNDEAQNILNEASEGLEITETFSPPRKNELKTYGELKSKLKSVFDTGMNDIYSIHIFGYIPDALSSTFDAYYGDDTYMKEHHSDFYGDGNLLYIRRNADNDKSPYYSWKANEKVHIGNTEYTVSKIEDKKGLSPISRDRMCFITTAIDDSFLISSIDITIQDNTDQAGLTKINEAVQKAFKQSAVNISIPLPKPLMEKQFNNMIYVLAIIIIMVVLLNVSRLYNYIMSTRKKALAIFSVCGASRLKIFTVYITEIFITLLLSFAVGCAVFHFGLIGLISTIYPTFAAFFTTTIYLTIFGIYMGVGLIIMTFNIIPIINKSVNELTIGGT